MKPRFTLLVAVMIIALLWPFSLNGQQQSPLFGTWRVNLAKSKFAATPQYSRMTCRIEPAGDGLKVTYDIVGTRGGVTHLEWTGRFDGKDYALQGLEAEVTNAYSRIDDRTYTVIVKEDGHTTTTSTITISSDNKVMTVKNTPAGSTVVYDRQ
nr:hypothetical protein Hi04_10k_c1170_00012 [uncultured bacterium]